MWQNIEFFVLYVTTLNLKKKFSHNTAMHDAIDNSCKTGQAAVDISHDVAS